MDLTAKRSDEMIFDGHGGRRWLKFDWMGLLIPSNFILKV